LRKHKKKGKEVRTERADFQQRRGREGSKGGKENSKRGRGGDFSTLILKGGKGRIPIIAVRGWEERGGKEAT